MQVRALVAALASRGAGAESPPAVPRLSLYLYVLPPRPARAMAGLGRAGVGRPRLGRHAGRGLRAGEPSASGEPPAELAAVSEPGLTRGAASARLPGHRRRARRGRARPGARRVRRPPGGRCVESSRPEASASSPYSTPRQRQIKLRAAFSLGHPRSIGRCALAGRPYRPYFPHRPCFFPHRPPDPSLRRTSTRRRYARTPCTGSRRRARPPPPPPRGRPCSPCCAASARWLYSSSHLPAARPAR